MCLPSTSTLTKNNANSWNLLNFAQVLITRIHSHHPLSCCSSTRTWSFGLVLFLTTRQTTVTNTPFNKVIMNFRKFSVPWTQRNKISVIPGISPLFLVTFHIFRYLMKGSIYFCNSPFHRLYDVRNCIFHVINNLTGGKEQKSHGSSKNRWTRSNNKAKSW